MVVINPPAETLPEKRKAILEKQAAEKVGLPLALERRIHSISLSCRYSSFETSSPSKHFPGAIT